jgi:homocysteine S-methyltransferase
MIFNKGIDLPAFASHTLLDHQQGVATLTAYLESFLSLAEDVGAGFMLEAGVWRAQRFFAAELGESVEALRGINDRVVNFAADIRRGFATNRQPIVIEAIIGPRGDAYAPESWMTAEEAYHYHREQIEWLAQSEADMITAMTLTNATEARGIVRAAIEFGMPCAISFTLETDGRLPSGQSLGEAIAEVDASIDEGAMYFMINCVHPTHILPALDGARDIKLLRERIRGLRCNASRLSHAELDCCETLDDGDPAELAGQYAELLERLPEVNIFGGCCGTDLRHVKAIAHALTHRKAA